MGLDLLWVQMQVASALVEIGSRWVQEAKSIQKAAQSPLYPRTTICHLEKSTSEESQSTTQKMKSHNFSETPCRGPKLASNLEIP